MSNVHVWPGLKPDGTSITVLSEDGLTSIPAAGGAVVPWNGYYQPLLRSGMLLDYDPLQLGGESLTIVPASGAVSVKTYGAVGDGVTDDTAALRSAIATGAPLFFPPGTYLVTATTEDALRLTGLTRVSWEGYGATIKMSSSVSSAGNTRVLRIYACTNVSIRGMTFDGNKNNRLPLASGQHTVGVYGGSTHQYTDCKFLNGPSEGLILVATDEDDLSTYPSDMVFENCDMTGCWRNGLGIIGGRRLLFRGGNYSSNAGNGDPEAGIDIESNPTDPYGTEDVVFDGCTFEGNAGPGIIVTGSPPLAAAISGTGNGTVTDLSVYGTTKVATDADPYILECIATAAHGGTFRLTDPDGVVVTSSLVMTAGAGVGTVFRAGGLQFKITDGSTDFGIGKIFHITSTGTHARNIQIRNIRGSGNGRCLIECAFGHSIVIDGVLSVGETTTPVRHGLVYVSNVAHGVTARNLDFSSAALSNETKALVYFDNGGADHSLDGLVVRNCNARALVVVSEMAVSNVYLEGLTGTESHIGMSAHRCTLRGVVARRCSGKAIQFDAATGSVADGITIVEPPSGAQGVLVNAAGLSLSNVSIHKTGDDPNVANPAVYGVYFADAATPKRVENVRAVATGTDYTRASVMRLPTSKAFRCVSLSPNPFTGTATWDPPDLAPGADASTTVSVPGALPGDAVTVTHGIATGGLVSSGSVSAADVVTVMLRNPSGAAGNVNMGSHTVTARIEKTA